MPTLSYLGTGPGKPASVVRMLIVVRFAGKLVYAL